MPTSLPAWKRELPMILTYSRIVIAPILLAILMIPWSWSGYLGAGIFILASITDWVDGYLARLYKVESNMGKLMDPIGDKLLVLAALIMLLAMGRVDAFMVFLLLARDIFIGGLRAVAAANEVVIAAKPFGKWKTALQMTAIPRLLIYDSLLGLPIARIGYVCMWISVIFSLISAGQYTLGYYSGRKHLL